MTCSVLTTRNAMTCGLPFRVKITAFLGVFVMWAKRNPKY